MSRALLNGLLLIPLTGCIVIDEENPPRNQPPSVVGAEAGCYWDDYNGDYIWYFTAEVWDPDGPQDVVQVLAGVYSAGQWADSFELYVEGGDPEVWFSDWLQYSTYLDCHYGGYTVDFVAYDSVESYDTLSVAPWTEAR